MKKHLIVTCSCALALSLAAVAFATPDKAAPAAEATAPAVESLSGKVLQTMDSGGYTYIYIQKKNDEKVWVAAPTSSVAVGSQVAFKGGMEMPNFTSTSLKRTFDKIIFADSVVTDSSTKGALPKDNEKGKSGGSSVAVASKDGKISVAKATGASGYTVKEVFAKSAKLNKKKVEVRGKVIKVSAGIMGKNWIHIQDGTGSQAKKNHNLVCTSLDMADVGDVVTVSGVLAKDKDFGGGYKYTAIIENAKITK